MPHYFSLFFFFFNLIVFYGPGYKLEVGDKTFEFSTAEHAPPEGIATGGYEA